MTSWQDIMVFWRIHGPCGGSDDDWQAGRSNTFFRLAYDHSEHDGLRLPDIELRHKLVWFSLRVAKRLDATDIVISRAILHRRFFARFDLEIKEPVLRFSKSPANKWFTTLGPKMKSRESQKRQASDGALGELFRLAKKPRTEKGAKAKPGAKAKAKPGAKAKDEPPTKAEISVKNEIDSEAKPVAVSGADILCPIDR